MAVGSLPLSLTAGSSTSKTELDPVTGRPQLNVSVNLNMKIDIASLVDHLLVFAKVQDVQHIKPSESAKETKEKLSEAEEPTPGRPTPAPSPERPREGPERQPQKKWTWDDPMYALQSTYEAYAKKPEVKWQRSEFEENDFFALEPDSEQKKAFLEMVFEPLPVPERIGITHANYKEADLKRFGPGPDTTSHDVMPSTPAPAEAKGSRPGSDGAAPLKAPVTVRTDGLREEGMVYPVSPGCKAQ
ncbi:unnamed protein product [Symbiodinium sp. CCMP2592]|nr:unnamed protein product [Symbiodinium sp. CCMP2592]